MKNFTVMLLAACAGAGAIGGITAWANEPEKVMIVATPYKAPTPQEIAAQKREALKRQQEAARAKAKHDADLAAVRAQFNLGPGREAEAEHLLALKQAADAARPKPQNQCHTSSPSPVRRQSGWYFDQATARNFLPKFQTCPYGGTADLAVTCRTQTQLQVKMGGGKCPPGLEAKCNRIMYQCTGTGTCPGGKQICDGPQTATQQ
jgi:hypothetical protein